MLYRDYARAEGEGVPNVHGGRESRPSRSSSGSTTWSGEHPDEQVIPEESTAWPRVTRPTHLGGLGFGLKWNMGWMHDTLKYFALDPIARKSHQDQITFAMVYEYSERFMNPLSHDEVVHGKGSLYGKMPGDRWQKFANLRAYYGFMWGHPGKKLLFMGGEFAQEREWNHDRSLDWHLLADRAHAGIQRLIHDLNRYYRATPPGPRRRGTTASSPRHLPGQDR